MSFITKAIAFLLCGFLLVGCELPKPPRTIDELVAGTRADDAGAAEELLSFLGSRSTNDERALAYRTLLEKGKLIAPRIIEACTSSDSDAGSGSGYDQGLREHALALAANLKLEGTFEAASKALADPGFKRAHAAAWALGELGDPAAIGALVTALISTPSEIAAREAARALARFGPKAIIPLVEGLAAMNTTRRGYALRNLGELRDVRGRPALIAALRKPATRADAVWALGTMGRVKTAENDGNKIFDLTAYLQDDDWRVRVEASRSVGLLRDRSAVPQLDALRQTDGVMAVREWAARGLSLIKGEPQPYMNSAGEWVITDSLYH
jgi:HEAT repeat protein